MSGSVVYQQALFPELVAHFPSTRYQGSKAKLADWIWAQIAALDFDGSSLPESPGILGMEETRVKL